MTLSSDLPLTTKTYIYPGSTTYTPKPIWLDDGQCQIRPHVTLANFTSFRVGGPAEWYAAPKTREGLQACFAWAQDRSLPTTILGAGSNLLISDRGLPGLVVSTRHLRLSVFDDETGQVTAGAGELIPRLAWRSAKRGWQGLEWSVGIPGTVGGAVVMNAGAHQGCIADSLVQADVLNPDGHIVTLRASDFHYRYRHSSLQGDKRLVLQATFQLQPTQERAIVMETTNENLQNRKNSQPYHLPSCGSVFRNPESYKAGWLIEQIGLKGFQIGGAQVAHRHANFILNCGNAKAQDIFETIHHVQQQVEHHWSLRLRPEVKVLGEFQTI
ncbi:UDP-N-acetylmuramate dehydrogenase [Spirulina major CS-329]|uniref:UDP-N-acetylmuramate dehydrogenase n=1 Tax=Spirulina TaxID=1154 RepID=UPI00232DABF2|nr:MULTISPECIES: UDP-N-acetylmuramate dehydrogenase [Spirulina]MDB9494093.1 UDP-N-acetylmuramate dehydrogenase [Spirulina subsalsa CS-330]MDB9505162.1 UDP-N-acetylmuramate dehydrogenase [Spirulina major CS-329]